MNDLLIVSLFGLKEIYGKEPVFLVYNKGVSAAIATFESEIAAQAYCFHFHELKIKKQYFLRPHITKPIRLITISKTPLYTVANFKAHFNYATLDNRITLIKINSKLIDGKTIAKYMQSTIEKKQIKDEIESQSIIKGFEHKK